MYMVRNPNYDQATDDNRQNNVDGFSLVINTNLDDIYNRVLNGDIDLAHGAPAGGHPAAVPDEPRPAGQPEDRTRATGPGTSR